MEKNLDITKPRHSEQILPVPLPFVTSRFHCTLNSLFLTEALLVPVFLHWTALPGGEGGGSTPSFGLNGYMLVNRVWFSGS